MRVQHDKEIILPPDGQIKVCFLTESFYPVVGGGESHIRLLGSKLRAAGIPVFVLTHRRIPGLKKKDSIDGIPIIRVWPNGMDRWGKYLMMLPSLYALVRLRSKYDIIYVCGLRTLGLIALLAACLLGKKCLMRSESRGEFSGDFIIRRTSENWLVRTLLKTMIAPRNFLYRYADGFVSISSIIHKEYAQCGVARNRIFDITNGIDTKKFSPADVQIKLHIRPQFNLPAQALIFSYTGKYIKGKGLELLLRVWKRIRTTTDKHCHLVLVGSGENQYLSCETELRSFVNREHLNDSVTFTGYTERVSEYLQASDFFVFPSESEALPISVLEALTTGLPTIACSIGGITDIITNGNNGVLVPVNNAEALYDAMMRYLETPDQAAFLGKKGRVSVIEKFSIEKVAKQHQQLFERLQRSLP